MTGISEMLMDADTASRTIVPAHFDAFLKVLALFVKIVKAKFINIVDSRLRAADGYGRTIYDIDVSTVFPSPETLAFVVTREELQAVEGLGGNSEILLLEDESCFYLVGETGLATLSKYRGKIPRIAVPDLEESNQIGETVIIEDSDSFSRAVKGAKWTDLLTHDGQLTGFITSSSVFRIFASESCSDVVGKVPDGMYKSRSFMKIVGSTAHLSLFNLDGKVWLKTCTNIGKPKKGGKNNEIGPPVTIYERLMPAGMSEFQRLFSLLATTNAHRAPNLYIKEQQYGKSIF